MKHTHSSRHFQFLSISFFVLTFFTSLTVVHGQTATPDNFIVFVGEKINIDTINPNPDVDAFDKGFKAKYKIIKVLYGNYTSDTIEFQTYIHRGNIPEFSKCKNPLLYISKHNGKWYHEKYLFDEVYPTKNGRWAGTGKSDDYAHAFNKNVKIKPEKIEFNDSVWYEGNYIEELFFLKKNGVLHARKLF